MYRIFFISSFLLTFNVLAQKDSLRIGEKYWEDQLYMSITYDLLRNQPDTADDTGFSYSLSFGYIKDIPFSKSGKLAGAFGLGYGYSSFNHDLQVIDSKTIQVADNISSNKFKTHSLEFPLQLRWRSSSAATYSFWRVYTGVKFSYNLSNSFTYQDDSQLREFTNIDIFNKFQTGLEISAGYDAFNFYLYYGLNSMYKNAAINGVNVSSKITKFGLIFYLL
ncbi:hypothetical protein BTO06_00645 [Tenacibaculum sp. SZ-18]|uniref:porin family protein n=1 Tax=Tenacibaculum sp. SZ-18 TaxID=754423 RepID=UPI000C2D676F|nr:porin family protein [Tenacibaculum sp. SZ-18]AUC13743.1 hypothetical protein BTO06_00645 [Tenacibaculum sp. SZ-18]